ncbi:50S ribosomal protein L18 [Candidatus Azambacteria bacterium RIFCSPHIGHO2_02_FULL_52_12]|uniref:Large ribosomal subunit protein uL18 n=1 Tax=Candidatus Azambacteria bacterium RIFCSPLOWO2_01_FULL_46_25 TaxID=1797298 RepID=A0A1F5BU56_9BACT|nr:MAG: 50S ribosomal protein L18 [Candidatus Azambacteria bacterium RIFCSPHIGHO2_02_FULL_52_12]OGD34127.1 MAG: 50S ribosomal protein L18 [Candidatus Azambacteria bacterium RIFCSPLOWO2_01_FULL_46_25]OGD36726.1 MAG: 50S ribosomal protein L18 [Candidatus Azambacteria bacterium RIFCSPHIGHO2_01_FULL_51_74]
MDRVSIHKRIRAKVAGTTKRPRLSVFRSNQHIYAQLIDDEKGETLSAVSDAHIKKGKHTKSELAKMVGMEIAKKAKAAGVDKVVFDRGGFRYHGRVRHVADGAREGGLAF